MHVRMKRYSVKKKYLQSIGSRILLTNSKLKSKIGIILRLYA